MQQHEALQHIDEHYILEAAARNLPAARLRLERLLPLLPNTQLRSIAVAAPVPQDPDASAKPNVPVTSSGAAARGRGVISPAALVGAAPSKHFVELHCSHETFNKCRSQRSTKLVGAIADALPNRTLHAWERCDATQERLSRKLGQGAGLRESGMSGAVVLTLKDRTQGW